MGCQQSHSFKNAEGEAEVPSLGAKNANRRKIAHQRINARCTAEEVFQNIKQIAHPKTPADIDFIEKAISKHFLLFKLSKQERRELANAMQSYETPVAEYVFKQGTPASMFFIIHEGEVEIEINNAPVKHMGRGDFFGELALIYSSPRSASVRVVSRCVFWCLSQHLFLKIQRDMVRNNFRVAKPFVNKLPLFSFLSTKQKDAISYNMNTLKYEAGEPIFKAGDDAVSFIVIIAGLVEIHIPGKTNIQFKSGDSFGENCLKENQIRSGTALCIDKTELLAISREDLKYCLGDKSLEELLFHNIVKWAFRRSEIFNSVPGLDQAKLITLGQFSQRSDEQVLAEEGVLDDKLYICLEGKINDFEVGVIINEDELCDDSAENFPSRKKLVKKEPGYVFSIGLRTIQKEKKSKLRSAQTLKKLQSRQDLVRKREDSAGSKVEFKDLYVLCKLGEGQMGKVYLVENKKTEKRYALKCVEKNIVLKHQMEKFIKCEKEILQTVDSPFIVTLYETYKDSHFVYLLLNYIEGGDFFDFLSELGICNATTAQFYFGCLYLGIEYLHRNSIVYRDLKPQNAAIDSNGYLRIIDLGTAKLLTDDPQTGFRTFTIIGTPHYMAPEVMQAKGYAFSVDIWSLGIILYEMVCGALPYGGYSDDPVSIYKQIQKNDLRFPKNYTDFAGKQLMLRLLQKHPQKRQIEDYNEIKQMQYFRNFNWQLLQGERMNAPVRPKIVDGKWNSKSQYLLSYLQKEKMKMEKPVVPKNSRWDQIF